jgi:ATP-dependent Clp protease protease subunit
MDGSEGDRAARVLDSVADGEGARGPGGLPSWLHDALLGRRIVLITGRLDDAAASEAAARIVLLDRHGDAPIEVHLDSPDGTLGAAFLLIDVLDAVRSPVHAHCWGQAGGPLVGVVALAARRTAAPHARFRLSQPVDRYTGTPEQIAAWSHQQQEDLLWRLQARLARVTGRPAEEIAEDMRRGRYLDAQEALEYGLIDAVEGRSS